LPDQRALRNRLVRIDEPGVAMRELKNGLAPLYGHGEEGELCEAA